MKRGWFVVEDGDGAHKMGVRVDAVEAFGVDDDGVAWAATADDTYRLGRMTSRSCATTSVSMRTTQPPNEGVQVELADLLEELDRPGLGQGLGELVLPVPVFVLQGPELGQGRGPPRRPRFRPGRARVLDRDAGRAALPEAALAFGGGESHGLL